VSPGTSSYKVDTQIRFKSNDDIIIQLEQLILQIMLGGDDNTNSSIGDPEFCRPAWKNTRLQSPPHQTANEPYDKLSHLDYKLHDVVTKVAELLDGLASQTGDSQGRAIECLESSIEQIWMCLKHICTIPCPTNNEATLWLEMLERYEGILRGMKQAKEIIQNRKSLLQTILFFSSSLADMLDTFAPYVFHFTYRTWVCLQEYMSYQTHV
jgi:hypothetical protein